MKRFGCGSDLTTPFKDATIVFLTDENAPYAKSGKDFTIGYSPSFQCIEIAATSKTTLEKS
jgi:hypothetical protein